MNTSSAISATTTTSILSLPLLLLILPLAIATHAPRAYADLQDLVVQVNDQNGTATSGAQVSRYTTSWSYLDYRTTGSDGKATWTQVTTGSYGIIAVHNSSWAGERWSKGTAGTGGVNLVPRTLPYATAVRFYNNSTSQQLQSTDSVPEGTVIRVEADVLNKYSASISCKLRLIMDRDKATPWDLDTYSASQSVPANNGTVTLTLTYTTSGTGTYYRALILWVNYSLPTLQDWPTDSWDWYQAFQVVAAPAEITVLDGGGYAVIPDGDTTPTPSDGTDFGTITQGGSTASASFKVRNDGGSTLTLGAVSVPTGFTLTEGLSTSLAPGASDTFTVRLDNITAGTKTGDISFSNNDSDENPYNFRITGKVNAALPEITVLDGGGYVVIPDGDTTPTPSDGTDFGTITQGGSTASASFKVRNDGNATLTLGTVSVPTGFTLTEGLSTSLAPGASDSFTVRLDNATAGTKTGDISFSNNDSDENPYNFRITGTVQQPCLQDLAVEVRDQNDAIKSGVEVDRYDTSWNYQAYLTTGADGRATWSQLPCGGYGIIAIKNSAWAGERWAKGSAGTGGINIVRRTLPYVTVMRFYNNSTSQQLQSTDSVPEGTSIRVEADVLNKYSDAMGCKLRLIMDRDKATPWDLDTYSASQSVPANNGTVTLSLTYTTSGTGTYSRALILFVNYTLPTLQDWPTDSWDWYQAIQVVAAPPEITVLDGGGYVVIADGDTTPTPSDGTDFGTITQGGSTASASFKVRNDGGSSLTLGAVTVPTGFTLTKALPSSLAPGASDTFTVRLDNAVPGTKTGDVSISNNDTTQNPYTFRIIGRVNATAPATAPSLISPADGATVYVNVAQVFQCGTVSGATGYKIQFDGTGFNAMDANQQFTLVSSVTGPHTWRCCATNGASDGPWSSTRGFTITATPAPQSPLAFVQNYIDGGISALSTSYASGDKTLVGLWLGGGEGIEGQVEMWIDLDDYLGITQEGQGTDPYVTIWMTADIRIGVSTPWPVGFDVLQLEGFCSNQAEGDGGNLTGSYASVRAGFKLAELSCDHDANLTSWWIASGLKQQIDFGSYAEAVLGFSYQVAKFDIKKSILDQFLSQAIHTSLPTGGSVLPIMGFGQALASPDLFTAMIQPGAARFGLAANSDLGPHSTQDGIAGFTQVFGEAPNFQYVRILVQNADNWFTGNYRLTAYSTDGFSPAPPVPYTDIYEDFSVDALSTSQRIWSIEGNNSAYQSGSVHFLLWKKDILGNWNQIDGKDYHLTMLQTNSIDAVVQVSCTRLSDTGYNFPISVSGDLTAGYGAHVHVRGGSIAGVATPPGMSATFYDELGNVVNITDHPTVCEFIHTASAPEAPGIAVTPQVNIAWTAGAPCQTVKYRAWAYDANTYSRDYPGTNHLLRIARAPYGSVTAPDYSRHNFDPSFTFLDYLCYSYIFNCPSTVAVTLQANPPSAGTVTGSGTYAVGASVTATARPAAGCAFLNWTEGGTVVSGSPTYTFTASTNRNLLANFAVVTVSVTVETSPSGRSLTVDGTNYTSPQTFIWTSGSSHTIATTSPQNGGSGTQYVWSNWSDGGAMSHTIAPNANATYTANFATQYLLIMSAGTGGTVAPASGWQNNGASVSISAISGTGYAFGDWTGTGSGSYSGLSNPASVTMSGPISETASFTNTSCTYVLTPTATNISASAAACTFVVAAATGCAWTASTTNAWLHTASSGTGNGIVSFTADANSTTAARTGAIAIQNQVFLLSQAGASTTSQYQDRPIVFGSNRSGTNSIWRMNPDGTGLTQLTSNPQGDGGPRWSPDGSAVAFARGTNLMLMNADGSNQRVVSTFINGYGGIRWAPDRSYLSYAKRTISDWYAPYYRINLDGTGEALFLDQYGKTTILGFHPSGNSVVWAGATGNWEPNAELYTAPISSGIVNLSAATRLTTNSAAENCPSYSPDGSTIMFTRTDSGSGYGNPHNIHLVNADGTNDRKLTSYTGSDSARFPVWSPSSNQIIYQRESGGRTCLIVRDLTSSSETQVTASTYDASEPDWCMAWTTINSGLVAYYPLDGNARDASGNGNDGTVNGAVPTSDRNGKAGGAYYFGRGNYILVPNSTSLNSPASQVTVCAWARIDALDGGRSDWGPIVCKATSGSWHYCLEAYNGGSGGPPTALFLGAGIGMSISPAVNLGQWHYLVATYDGAVAIAYQDGREVGRISFSGSLSVNNDPVYIGADLPGSAEYMIGAIDEVRIYNRALNGAEVAALAGVTTVQMPLSITTCGDKPVLTWPFGSLLSADDLSGPWAPVIDATSPWTNTAASGRKFYRLRP